MGHATGRVLPTRMGMALATFVLAACGAMTLQAGRPPAEPRDVLLMASTIGPIDAGIVAALEDAYFARTGVLVRHAGADTGAALDMAKRGGFDLVMVHARALFITRGDNSGTHVKEKELWEAARIKPGGPWYVAYEKGASGNAPATRYANERQAYVLMDRATFLTLKSEITLQVLVEKDPDLLNYIAVIRVNPAKFPRANAAGANAFVDWLCSEEAQRLIKDFGVGTHGESLFFPNSDEWRKRDRRG